MIEKEHVVKKGRVIIKIEHVIIKTVNVDHFAFDCTLSLHRERV